MLRPSPAGRPPRTNTALLTSAWVRPSRRHYEGLQDHVSRFNFEIVAILGAPRLRVAATVRRGSRGRDHAPGNVLARARTGALRRGLRAAEPSARRRALRRKSQPAVQAFTVSTNPQAVAGRCARHLPEEPRRYWDRSQGT